MTVAMPCHADAERAQAVFEVSALGLVEHGAEDHGAGGERMAERWHRRSRSPSRAGRSVLHEAHGDGRVTSLIS